VFSLFVSLYFFDLVQVLVCSLAATTPSSVAPSSSVQIEEYNSSTARTVTQHRSPSGAAIGRLADNKGGKHRSESESNNFGSSNDQSKSPQAKQPSAVAEEWIKTIRRSSSSKPRKVKSSSQTPAGGASCRIAGYFDALRLNDGDQQDQDQEASTTSSACELEENLHDSGNMAKVVSRVPLLPSDVPKGPEECSSKAETADSPPPVGQKYFTEGSSGVTSGACDELWGSGGRTVGRWQKASSIYRRLG
jgi:hypothetical protein